MAANLILAAEGVLDAMGHVSVRHPARPDRYFLARSMAPALVTAADIIEYDLDSTAVTPSARTGYLERFIHGETYRARPDVRAVVHCHTPSLIPFASSTVPLRAMYHMAAFVAAGVPVWDIATAAGVTDLLVRDGKLATVAGRVAGRPRRGADARPRRRGGGRLAAQRRRPQRLPGRQRHARRCRPWRSAARSAA